MFFFDSSDFLIFSGKYDKSLYPGIIIPVCLPPASWASLTSSWDAVGMLGNVFDHQAPLTRPLEAVVAACSTSRSGIFIDFH